MAVKQHSVKFNAALNMIKQCCSVIFPLITVPYVARVLSTDSYGQVSYAYSIISYFILLAGLGASTYAIREGAMIRTDKKKLERFSNEVYTITLTSTFITFVLLVVLVLLVPKFRNITSLLFLFSLTFVLTTLGADWINTIFEDFAYITIRYIVFQIISLILIFLLVRHHNDSFKYAITMVVASGGANLLNIIYIRRYVHLKPVRNVNWKKHLKPIFIMFFSSLAGTIYVNSDITILGLMTSESSTGIYSMTSKVYLVIKHLIMALIAAAVPRISAHLGQGKMKEYRELVKNLFDTLLFVIPPAVVGMVMLAKEIILIVGGAKYERGVLSFIILSFAIFFACFATFFNSAVLIPFKREKLCLYGSTISAIVNIVLNIILIPKYGFTAAAVTTLISEMLIYIMYLAFSKKNTKIEVDLKSIVGITIGCMVIIVICLVLRMLVYSIILRTLLSIALSVIFYFLITLGFKNQTAASALNIVLKKIKH